MNYKSFIHQITSEKIIAGNSDELNKLAAAKFVALARQATVRKGRFTVALAGGSTPKGLYQLLGSDKFRALVDWKKVFFFFGDERNVLPDNEESNFRTANENLLFPLEINAENVFRWQTEIGDAAKTAQNYERTIKNFFDLTENGFPRFDLILLGMGNDGHTASLFPFTDALRETEKIAVSNRVEKLNTERLTITFPVINNAANVVFLVSGAEKAAILRTVLEGESEPEKYPAQMVKLKNGGLFWLIDESVARFLQ